MQKGFLSRRLTQNQRKLSLHTDMALAACPASPFPDPAAQGWEVTDSTQHTVQQLHKSTPLGKASVINRLFYSHY